MKTRLTVIGGIAALICLMVLTSQGTLRANAEGEHQHCVCGGYYGASSTACPYNGTVHTDGVEWTAWDATNTLPAGTADTPGYYYLTADVKLTGQFASVTGSTVYLCLNGHKIIQTKAGDSGAFRILTFNSRTNTKYVFTDCSATDSVGEITKTSTGKNGQGTVFWLTGSGNSVEVYRIGIDGSQFGVTNKSGGPIAITGSNCSFKAYGSEIIGSGAYVAGAFGGTIGINAASASLILDGCKVTGGSIGTGGAYSLAGGAIGIKNGTVTIQDSEIIGGSATNGGAVYIEGGTCNVKNSSITGGTVTEKGKTVYKNGGTLVFYTKSVIEEIYVASGQSFSLAAGSANRLTNGAFVGVAMEDGTGFFSTNNEGCAYNMMFVHPSDNTKYVSYDAAENRLALKNISDVSEDDHCSAGHCVCGYQASEASSVGDHTEHEGIKWIPWESDTTIPRGFAGETGYYYLTTDVNASVQVNLEENANVYLCLNGHKITFSHNGRLLALNTGTNVSHYTVTNCGEMDDTSGKGKIVASSTGTYSGQGGIFWVNGAGNSLDLYRVVLDPGNHKVSNYGAVIAVSNGKLNAYDVYIHGGESTNNQGGALALYTKADVKLYNSTVVGGKLTGSGKSGGNILVRDGSTLLLQDCMIQNGEASAYGGNVCAETNTTTEMIRTTLSGGSAKAGGNVWTNTGAVLNITDSFISGGTLYALENDAANVGGNILSKGTTSIIGTDISGGKGGRGGNVDVAGGLFTMLGGTISDGYAPSGANVRVETGAEMVMESGSILNPAGYTPEGGTELLPSNNVYLNLNAMMTMSGGTIASDTSHPAVHGVQLNGSRSDHETANAVFTLEDGTIRSGSDSTNAIRNNGDLIVNGGFVDGTIYSADYQESPIHPATISLSGGYYSERPEEEYVAEGCRVFDDTSVEGYYFTIAGGYQVETASGALTGEIYAVAPISGGGPVRAGESFTLTAPQVSGYQFVGWYENGALIPGATALTYTDTATEDRTLVATYRYGETEGFRVIVEGTEDFTVNGTAAAGQFPSGTEVTVAYTGTGEFRGWTNAGGKLLSRDQEYVFTLSSDITLKALASGAETPLAVFYNVSYQMMTLITAGAGLDASKIPTLTALRGRNLLGWKANGTLYADNAALAEYLGAKTGSGITEVYASYEESTDDSAKYQVTVSYRELGESGVPADWTRLKDDTVLEAVNVTNTVEISADETLGGKSFLGFADADGEKLSLSATTMVRFDADTTVYAVYGSITVEPEPSVRFVTASKDGNTVYFEALRNVPEGYTLKEQGILFTTDALKGEVPAEDALLYNSNDVVKFTSNGKLANDVTGLTLKNLTVMVYARAYVVYEKDGVDGIIYSEVSSK